MKRKLFGSFLLVAVCAASAQVVLGQRPSATPTRDDIVRENLERRMNTMRNLDALARWQTQAGRRQGIASRYYKPVLSPELEEQRKASDAVLRVYRELLSLPDTGVVKLVAQKDCGDLRKRKELIKCHQGNSNIREFANAFSFREKRRTVFGRSDLAVAAGYFVAGRRAVQTLLVDLGVRELGILTPDSKEISYLFDFVPGETSEQMDAQYLDLKKGLTVTNFEDGSAGERRNYSKAAEIVRDHVYALRTIAYRGEASEPSGKDADVVIIFRAVETDGNGGTTIVWREIARGEGMIMKMGEDRE